MNELSAEELGLAREILAAIRSNDNQQLASTVISAVVLNNPQLAPYAVVGARLLRRALDELHKRRSSDGPPVGVGALLRSLWPF